MMVTTTMPRHSLLSIWPLLFFLLTADLLQQVHASISIVNIGDFDKPMDPLSGRICGIGDMNKDGNTDVIVQQRVAGISNQLVIYLQTENAEFKNATQTIDLGTASQEDVFCMVGDFNGDACPDLLVVQPLAEDLDLIDKIKAVFASRKRKFQARVFLNERDGRFAEFAVCSEDGGDADAAGSKPCHPVQFVDHPMLVDVNGDGISDLLGFETRDGSSAGSGEAASSVGTALLCRAGQFQETVHSFRFKPCEAHFPTPRQYNTEFTPVFTDLDGDLASELAFVDMEENSSTTGRRRRLVVWRMEQLDDSDTFRWVQNDSLTIDLPMLDAGKRMASPVVADVDSDGLQEILIPICDGDTCESVSSFWCYKYNDALGRAEWHTVGVDLAKATIHPEVDGDTRVLFRIGDFSQNGFPDLIGTMSQQGGGIPVPLILENVLETAAGSNFTRKFQLSQKPQRILQKEVQRIHLSAFFDLKEDGNLDILYEYEGPSGPMVGFIKCDDKGDTTFLKVQIFTGPECSSGECCTVESEASKRVKIGSGIAWAGACVRIKMADSQGGVILEQGSRNSLQCQMPQSSHRIMHNPFVLFGLSRSPNFVEEVHLGAPRLPSMGRNQADFIRQIVPNSRVIVIPPTLGDRNGSWQSRLYVTPSRLIILSILVLVSMCVILLILIGSLHMRERHEDKKERQAQTHRFHFDAM